MNFSLRDCQKCVDLHTVSSLATFQPLLSQTITFFKWLITAVMQCDAEVSPFSTKNKILKTEAN